MSDKPKTLHSKTFQKYLQMYFKDNEKDITFTFEDSKKEIKAHKLVIKTVSSVFEKMFNGSFAEKDTVLIEGIKPEIFQKLIDVIYMQEVTVCTLEEAVELCNAAELYDVEDLKDIASDFMFKEDIPEENFFFIFEKAIQFNLIKVFNKYREFLRVSREIPTFNSSLLYHEKEINEEIFVEFLTINDSPDWQLYQMLEFFVGSQKLTSYKKALGKIRFLTMSIDEIILAELLTVMEKYAIISNIEANKLGLEPILPMPEHLSSETMMRQVKPETAEDDHRYALSGLRWFREYEWSSIHIGLPVCQL